MPDGSRHRTSARSDSPIRSVGRSRSDGRLDRHLEQRAHVAELEAAVDEDRPHAGLAEATARLKASVVLPTPPLGAKTRDHPGEVDVVARPARSGGPAGAR